MKFLPVWVQSLLQVIGYTLLGLGFLWSVGALWYFSVIPMWIARCLALAWLVLGTLLLLGVPRRWAPRKLEELAERHATAGQWMLTLHKTPAILVILGGILIMALLWPLKTPQLPKQWKPDQERDVAVRYGNDGLVTIDNLRYTKYRDLKDYDVDWVTRTYDLNKIATLDIIIEPFMEWRGASHFMISFGFDDGEHLAVSVEARIEEGEGWSLLKGIYKEYELSYTLGDERDLVHRRIHHQNHEIYIYPIQVRDREQLRALFVLVLNHAQRLKTRPLFYDTISRNCTNEVLRHIEYLAATELPWFDYRLILPGYVSYFLFEAGVLDAGVPLEDLDELSRVTGDIPQPEGFTGPEWSALLRDNLPRSANPPQ